MIFRKRHKPSVVKYTFDARYASEAQNNYTDATKGMQDQELNFKAWTDYPAMKSCDMIRKLSSYTDQAYENLVEGSVLTGTTAQGNVNMARHNIRMWDKLKKMFPPNAPRDQSYAGLNSILTQVVTAKNKTIRACPSIKDLLTQTLLIKCPTDIHFAKGKNGEMYDNIVPIDKDTKDEIRWHWFSPAQHLASLADPWGESHPRKQFNYGKGSQMKGYSNLKINTGLKLEFPDHITAMMIQPTFHNINIPMTVVPGIFMYPINKCVSIIPNFWIHDDQEDFVLKKGDALCYITFSENVKFEEDERGSDHLVQFAFNTPQLSWRNLAAKLRHDGD